MLTVLCCTRQMRRRQRRRRHWQQGLTRGPGRLAQDQPSTHGQAGQHQSLGRHAGTVGVSGRGLGSTRRMSQNNCLKRLLRLGFVDWSRWGDVIPQMKLGAIPYEAAAAPACCCSGLLAARGCNRRRRTMQPSQESSGTAANSRRSPSKEIRSESSSRACSSQTGRRGPGQLEANHAAEGGGARAGAGSSSSRPASL